MKLGLLGCDPSIRAVALAAVARGDTIALACDVAAAVDADDLLAGVPRDGAWQTLLDPEECDAILVAADGWNDTRSEAVRQLVQAGRTLVLSHPTVLSMLWAYEIDMIRADSGARLVPCLPDRLHPFVRRLQERIEAGLGGAGSAGPVETILFERRLADRSRESVLRALARDADLVRALVGDPSRLSTLGGADPASAWNTLAVGFSGPAHVPVRWQVSRAAAPGLRVSLMHADASCAVEIPEEPDLPWTFSEGTTSATAPFDRGRALVDLLHGSPAAEQPAASWSDAARAIELAETVPRSLAKGRAIDLHQEEFSEIGTFRGTMASLGCGLVLAALLLLVVATLVGGIARETGWGFGERIAGAWPQVVLAVLTLFLVLQLLPLLVGAGRHHSGGGNADTTPPRE